MNIHLVRQHDYKVRADCQLRYQFVFPDGGLIVKKTHYFESKDLAEIHTEMAM